MNKQISHNQATYTPQQHKSFASALAAFFANECPQLGGTRTRQVLVQAIDDMRRTFYPETSHLQPGQTVWTAVHKQARPAYGKSIDKTELTPVVLDLVGQEEIDSFVAGLPPEKKADMKEVILALHEKGLIEIEESGTVH